METSQAEEVVRGILQSSLKRSQSMPADDGERAELMNAYWATVAGARKHLVKVVGHRAAAAFGGFNYQNADDVLDDAFLEAWDRLDEQFTLGEEALTPIPSSTGAMSEKRRFIFNPEGKLSLVGWIAVVIGTGHGQKGGVLGDYLERNRLEAARLVELPESDDDETSAQLPGSAAANPEYIAEHRRTFVRFMELFYAELEKSKPEERFAIECLWLFFELKQGRDSADFWCGVEALINKFFNGDKRQTSMALVKAMQEKATAHDKLLKGHFLEMLSEIVNRSTKQVSRWFDDCVTKARNSIDGKSGDLGAQPA